MSKPANLAFLREEPRRVPASDVKKSGWRSLMRSVQAGGAVVVTNHNSAQAVILGIEEFEFLVREAGKREQEAELAVVALRDSFDQRLAALRATDAADRLRSLATTPARLGGKVKAGATF